MTKELISIIVPIYNTEKYLERCVTSLINQTYKNIEIILVDDGSPDASPALCDKFAKSDKRIKVIHKKNGGVSSARNTGLENAKGKYICFVDSDDCLSETYISSLYSAYKTDTDLVVCGFTIIDDDKNTIIKTMETQNINFVISNANNFCKFILDGFFDMPVNKLYKKSLIKSRFDTNLPLGEDRTFNLEYFKSVKNIEFVNEHGYYYIFNSSSACHKKRKNLYEIITTSLYNLRNYLVYKFESYSSDNYFKLIIATFNSILTKSDVSDFKVIKMKVKQENIYQEFFNQYKPKTLKDKIKFWLLKHYKFSLITFISKRRAH